MRAVLRLPIEALRSVDSIVDFKAQFFYTKKVSIRMNFGVRCYYKQSGFMTEERVEHERSD